MCTCLGGLSLPKNSMVRSTDRPDKTILVSSGCKARTQQIQHGASVTKK